MMLYHVTLLAWSSGERIAPAGWGRRIRAIGVGHTLYFRERELEAARLRVSPAAPSRWTCSFAFADRLYAEAHAQQLARSQNTPFLLYEVRVPSGAGTVQVSMGYIDSWWALREIREIEPWADGYWNRAPYVGQDSEVLVEGPLEVVRFLSEARPT